MTYTTDWRGKLIFPQPTRTGVLVSRDHLERIAFDNGLPIELDRQCAFVKHRGSVFYAVLSTPPAAALGVASWLAMTTEARARLRGDR